MKKIAVLMGSDSDLPVVKAAFALFREYGVPYEAHVMQMPSGMPVATVAIDGAANAALLAVQMLSMEDAALASKLDAKRAAMRAQIAEKDARLQKELETL